MKRSSGERDETPSRPITFRAAEDLGPFELAQLWCDRTAWPIDERSHFDELSELAVMSALATWLRRWQPVAIHSAILAGAGPEAVAGALGERVEDVFDRWHEWALRQRDFIVVGRPAITGQEFELVKSKFTNVDPNLGERVRTLRHRSIPPAFTIMTQTGTKQIY